MLSFGFSAFWPCGRCLVFGMPLISLSAEEKAAALQAASPDLKYHLSEVGVPVDVQAALYHKGFTTLRLFSGIDESRLEVRAALAVEIGLKHDDNTQARQSVAVLLSAWESSRSQLVAEDRMRVESKLGQTHRIVQTSELSAMRQAVEAQVGQLQDDEVPAKSLIATKLEQIETLELKAEDLREVLCADDTEVDVFSGIIEHGSGNLKIKPGKATIPMPASPEELRLRHRRLALAWLMCGTKHKNQLWISSRLVDAFRRFSDHVAGKHVAGLPILSNGATRYPTWKLVLSYEFEVRKKAYRMVRDGKSSSLADALEASWESAEITNKHFLLPLTVSADFLSDSGKGGGKGAKGDNKGKGAKIEKVKKQHLKTKTGDGRKICFKFNNGKCKLSNCTFAHVCQLCLQEGHGKKACAQKSPDESES